MTRARREGVSHIHTQTHALILIIYPCSPVPFAAPLACIRSTNPQLLGFSAASSLSLYYVSQETSLATGQLVASVETLQSSMGRITSYLDRLGVVEKDLDGVRASVAAKEDVGKVRGEMKKVYVGWLGARR